MSTLSLAEATFASYGLALRVTGDTRVAMAAVAGAARVATDPGTLVRLSRRAARRMRQDAIAQVQRPVALAALDDRQWAVVERIALRAMTVSEAAEELGLGKLEVLALLRGGLAAAGGMLRGEGQLDDHPEAPRVGIVKRHLAARCLDDAPHDRQPKAAAGAGLSG